MIIILIRRRSQIHTLEAEYFEIRFFFFLLKEREKKRIVGPKEKKKKAYFLGN